VDTTSLVAPEQASGAEPGPETDIWAIGAVMFRCLAGVEAFEGPNEAKALMQVVLGRARRLRTLEPSVPKLLASVVERALENEPARRYRDVRRLVRALPKARSIPRSMSRVWR
jgi:serine/threonine-protein kinase